MNTVLQSEELLDPLPSSVVPGAAEDVIVVVEARTGRVLSMSDGAERLTGFAREQVVGHPAWDTLVPTENIGLLRAASLACTSTGTPMTLLGPIRTVAGEVLEIEWLAASLGEQTPHRSQVLFYAEADEASRGAQRILGHLARAAEQNAVLTTDLHGTVTFASSGAAALLGRAAGALVGQPFPLEILDPAQVAHRAVEAGVEPGLPVLLADPTRFERRSDSLDLGDLDHRRAVAQRPQVRSADWTVRRSDGRAIIVSVTTRPLRDAAGRLVGHISVGEDVTESRAHREVLLSVLRAERESVARLRELDWAKREFIATVSHELRTPMTSIIGYVEHLRDEEAGPLTPEQSRCLEAVSRNAERLRLLADGLTTLLALETSPRSTELGPVALADVFARLRTAVGPLTEGRRVDVELTAPDPQLRVHGDPCLLELALRNLLANAVKFTEDGGRVSVSATGTADSAALEVADTGIGMTPEERRDVFERFSRGAQARARVAPGAGLGLSLVDAVVREHRGEIRVESEPGVGSVFTLLLPRSPGRTARVVA